MNLLLKSNLSRRSTPTMSKLKQTSTTKSLRDHCDFSKLKRSTNCRSSSKLRLSIGIFALMTWAIICLIYLLCSRRFTRRWRSGFRVKPIYERNIFEDYKHIFMKHSNTHYNYEAIENENDYKIIYTNIGIVIPAYFNEHTLDYLDRILHNIYLSQIDFEPESNITEYNNIYFPSEIIISMSITPEYYKYVSNMSNICNYYIDAFLEGNEYRLKMFYHYNITMNAAQNRNYGLSKINYNISEYIGFFDMDDIMHPQRIGILYNILNNNKHNIDFIFHSFIMHRHCKEKNIKHNYLNDFNSIVIDSYFNNDNMKLLQYNIQNKQIYEKDYCIAYYQQKPEDDLSLFRIECNNEWKKRSLIRKKNDYYEIFKFDRYYHTHFEQITFINYTQLVHLRCDNRFDLKFVKHPIGGELYDVSCDYGTMAGGLEKFRNQKAYTRHHNGWPTMKSKIAKKLKYDENWNLHGSYRGQDSGFNTDAYHNGAKIFHIGYYLGMYCYG